MDLIDAFDCLIGQNDQNIQESEDNRMNSEKIVQKQLEFYNNHDLEGFISTYYDEVEVYNLIDNSIMIRGKEQLKDSYREI